MIPKTIQQELQELKETAKRQSWESRRPSACPRAAWEAEESLKMTLQKIADLQEKITNQPTP